MYKLDTYLQGYPEFLHAPIIVMVIISLGYLLSKILAVVLAQLFQVTTVKSGETPTQGIYFIRLVFWLVWLVFIIIGLMKFPLVRGVFSNIYPEEDNFWVYFAIFFGAATISLLSGALKPLVRATLKPILQVVTFKSPLVLNLFRWGLFFVVLVAAGTSLDAPETFQQKIAASVLLLALGGILGLMVKEVVLNLLSIFDFTYSSKDIDLSVSIGVFRMHQVAKLSAPKQVFFGYIAFMLFLFAAIKLWVG